MAKNTLKRLSVPTTVWVRNSTSLRTCSFLSSLGCSSFANGLTGRWVKDWGRRGADLYDRLLLWFTSAAFGPPSPARDCLTDEHPCKRTLCRTSSLPGQARWRKRVNVGVGPLTIGQIPLFIHCLRWNIPRVCNNFWMFCFSGFFCINCLNSMNL